MHTKLRSDIPPAPGAGSRAPAQDPGQAEEPHSDTETGLSSSSSEAGEEEEADWPESGPEQEDEMRAAEEAAAEAARASATEEAQAKRAQQMESAEKRRAERIKWNGFIQLVTNAVDELRYDEDAAKIEPLTLS